MKYCSNPNCMNPANINGLLNESEFYHRKDNDKLRNHCKFCINLRMKELYQINSEYKKKYTKDRRKKYPEHIKAIDKKRSKTTLGKFKRLSSSISTRCNHKINYASLICLFVSQNGVCPFTNTKLNYKNMHLDHIKSVSGGGINDYDNLIFVKHVINRGKNSFGIRKYLHEMGELITKEQKQVILKRISDTHNRYEFLIEEYLEKSDKELELIVNDILSST